MRCRIAEDEEPASALAKLAGDARGARPRRGGAPLRRAAARAPARPRRADRAATARTSSPPGGSSSSGSPTSTRRCSSSRTCSGRTRRCSTSSSTCSSGRGATRSSCSRSRGRSCSSERPTWGAGQRNFTSLYLEPLSQPAMEELLDGLVPGPAGGAARRRSSPAPRASRCTRSRRCGCCSTAACSRRRAPSTGRPGTIEALEVPETLHALIAARLDGLAAEERRAAPGRAPCSARRSRRQALAALSGLAEAELEPLLASLVRKEVLGVQADPRSPERGQYGFLQDLRPARRLRDALEARAQGAAPGRRRVTSRRPSAGEQDEIVEVVAAHYLDAYEAAPDADDAGEIKAKAREMLARAGERAASLGGERGGAALLRAGGRARRRAARERAALLERAGEMAGPRGRSGGAASAPRARRSRSSRPTGETHAAARVSARLAESSWRHRPARRGARADGARLRGALRRRAGRGPRPARRRARPLPTSSAASSSVAAERVEIALDIAESLGCPRCSRRRSSAKGIRSRMSRGRPEEAVALLKHALEIALEHDLAERRCARTTTSPTARPPRPLRGGAGVPRARRSRSRAGSATAARVGDARRADATALSMLGRWDEALAADRGDSRGAAVRRRHAEPAAVG